MNAINHAVVLLSRQSRNLAIGSGARSVSVGVFAVQGCADEVLVSVHGGSDSCGARTIQDYIGESIGHLRQSGIINAPVRIKVTSTAPAVRDNDLS